MTVAQAVQPWIRVEPPRFDPAATRAWMRLIKAFALSAVVHAMVMVALPVNPTGGEPQVVTTITARLMPSVEDPVVEQPLPESAKVRETAPAPVIEPRKPVESKPEPKSELPVAKDVPSAPTSGIEVPFIRDPTYYPAKQLDVYPQPLTAIKLDYPESAASARVDGRVVVLLLIDEFGIVNDASIVEAQPEGYFEDAALAVFRAARFTPGQKQGRAVKSRVLLQVKYLYGQSAGAMR
mgnify:FL=1